MEVSGQFDAPGEKTTPGAHFIGDWLRPRAGPDVMEMKETSFLAGNRTLVVQPATQYLHQLTCIQHLPV
jgi:hypothetical protein